MRSQNSSWFTRILAEARRESLGVSQEGAGGVGGEEGMKKAGTALIEDWR
jgi:hypothetical protein